jgi:peptidoglycan/LPS O-acetylase OafA/YrhL
VVLKWRLSCCAQTSTQRRSLHQIGGFELNSSKVMGSERRCRPASSVQNFDGARDGRTANAPNQTFAVLAVVVFHILLVLQVSTRLNGLGHWGVLIFFVHTSLVLMRSLQRQGPMPQQALFTDFMLRRIFRIFPLSCVTVLLVYTFNLPVGHLVGENFVPVPIDFLTLISNLFLVQNITEKESVVATLWSLPYEMQMYFVLPGLFLLVRSVRSYVPLFAISAAAGLLAYYAGDHIQFPRYVPCFIAGVISYKLSLSIQPRLPSWAWPIFLIVISAAYLLRPGVRMGWICCTVLGLGIPFFYDMRSVILKRLFSLIAQYSYSIYLSHFITLWFAFSFFKDTSIVLQLSVFLVTTAAICGLQYHLIEAPAIALGKSIASSWRFSGPRQRFFWTTSNSE